MQNKTGLHHVTDPIFRSLHSEYDPNASWNPIAPQTLGQVYFDVGCDTTIGTINWTPVIPSDEYVQENPVFGGILINTIFTETETLHPCGYCLTQKVLITTRISKIIPKNFNGNMTV